MNQDTAVDIEPKVAVSPELDDAEGYNARVFTKSRIDNLVVNEFNGRKMAQIAKMQGLKAEVLNIDFNYNIARKIKVYTGRGKSFSPFKCIATIQNEDTQTIWWGGIAGSESMTKLQPALCGIKERCTHLGSTIKGCYVNNCCHVRGKLEEVVRDIFVKLDPFHWLKRWDAVLAGSSSVEGGVARVLFSRALFNVSPSEYERAKQVLRTSSVQQRDTERDKVKYTRSQFTLS